MKPGEQKLVDESKLVKQVYGIRMAQCTFGRPSGVWLECGYCNESQTIVGSSGEDWKEVSDHACKLIFLKHGWTGEGSMLKNARCPKCTAAATAASIKLPATV